MRVLFQQLVDVGEAPLASLTNLLRYHARSHVRILLPKGADGKG